jgi:hypothetical protein
VKSKWPPSTRSSSPEKANVSITARQIHTLKRMLADAETTVLGWRKNTTNKTTG